MKKAIVLGAGYGALAVVKALGQQGIPVVLLYTAKDDHAYHSRFASERVKIPNPMDDSDGLLHLLAETREDWDGAFLIPTLDEYIIFVSQNRDKLKERYVFTTQSWDIVDRVINKDRLYPQAQKNDVPTPRFFLPDSIEFLTEHQGEFSYPCILKPNETHKFDRLYGQKNFVVHDFQNLVELFTDTQKNGLEMMISEIIPGDDSSIHSYRSYIDSQGEILGEMCTQKLRQYPTGFGQAAVLKTTALIPEVREQALRLLRSLSFRGQSIVEFRWDHRDNQYKLMEINSRPGVTEWLEVKAGMNFPYMTYLDLVENIRTPTSAYRQELYWIHNYWEVINFFTSLRRGNLNLHEFLKPYWQEKVFVVPFSDDPVLFLFETYSNFKRALRKNRKSLA
jgi:D-aspartate ligase